LKKYSFRREIRVLVENFGYFDGNAGQDFLDFYSGLTYKNN